MGDEKKKYIVVFAYTKEAGGYEGVVVWTRFSSKEDFEKTTIIWDDLLKISDDFEKTKDDLEPTARYILDRFLKLSIVHSVRFRVKNTEHLIEKIIILKMLTFRKARRRAIDRFYGEEDLFL